MWILVPETLLNHEQRSENVLHAVFTKTKEIAMHIFYITNITNTKAKLVYAKYIVKQIAKMLSDVDLAVD